MIQNIYCFLGRVPMREFTFQDSQAENVGLIIKDFMLVNFIM
jgi:hypothetical protein